MYRTNGPSDVYNMRLPLRPPETLESDRTGSGRDEEDRTVVFVTTATPRSRRTVLDDPRGRWNTEGLGDGSGGVTMGTGNNKKVLL